MQPKRPGIAQPDLPAVKEDSDSFLYATTDEHRQHSKEYWKFHRDNNTPVWKKQVARKKVHYQRNRNKIIIESMIYIHNHKREVSERRVIWNKKTGYYKKYDKKHYKIRIKWRNCVYKRSGYGHIAHYLNYRGIKSPLNFYMSYKRKTWAWGFAHP